MKAPVPTTGKAAFADAASPGWMRFLFAPRPLLLLLAISGAIGAAHVLTMFSWRFVLGTAGFWTFPRGTVPGSQSDMAGALVGYLYFLKAGWNLPLLHVSRLAFPGGSNVFWLDSVPSLALLGRVLREITGQTVNLYGLYMFLAFALPGVAMTWVLAIAGQRHVVAAVAAALIADAVPYLLFEWGHVALCGQVLTIFALALYLLALRDGAGARIRGAWLALLIFAFLSNMYLFVMVGGIWTAGIVQRALNRREPLRGLWIEAAMAIGSVVALALLMGILSLQDRGAGTMGFTIFSMNLGSPLIPQLSGAIPPLRHYWIGTHSQVLTYVGLGALLVVLFAVPGMLRWLQAGALRRHAALLAVMAGYYMFALSTKITLGSHVLLNVPLPHGVAYALGAFRSSGRFFWPIGFAAMALAILTILRTSRPPVALAVLALGGVLQMIDVGPIRRAVAASTLHPVPYVLDDAAIARVLDRAQGVKVFPSFLCVNARLHGRSPPWRIAARLLQANIEIQLLAARRNLPINSELNARIYIDCAAEARAAAKPLHPGIAYVYLVPRPGEPPAGTDGCRTIGWARVCLPAAYAAGAGAGSGRN